MLLGEAKQKASFEENVFSKWLKNEKIPEDYSEKELELQFKSVSACLRARMIPIDYFVSVIFTLTDLKLLRSVVS